MFIRSRKKLTDNINANLPKYPLVARYFSRTIRNLLTSKKTLRSLLEVPLLRYLGTGSSTIENFENYLQEKSFANIEAPLKRLRSNLIGYPAVLAELETAKKLLDEGMTSITFLNQQNSHPDIKYLDEGVVRYAEVKDLMSINPEFAYLHDKLSAMGLLFKSFKRSFIVECEHNPYRFDSIQTLHEDLKKAIDNLIKELKIEIVNNEVDKWTRVINGFNFHVTTKRSGRKEFLFLFSGGGFFYGQPADVFLNFANVYARLITETKKGYLQLLNQRSNDGGNTKKDRLYIYLNIKQYSFSGKNIKRIFTKLSKTIGLNELVDLRIVL